MNVKQLRVDKVVLNISDPVARDALLTYSESLLQDGQTDKHNALVAAIRDQQIKEGCTLDQETHE